MVETLDQVRTQEPVPPSRWQPKVPLRPGDDLPEVPAQGARATLRLRRGAGRRPGSISSAANQYMSRPVGLIERGWRWGVRNRGLAATVTALAATTVGGLVTVAALLAAETVAHRAETERTQGGDTPARTSRGDRKAHARTAD